MEATAFVAASVSLLAAPGPTNTLLMASDATSGVRRTLPALAAALFGYMVSIALLRVVLGPVVAALPALDAALRVAAVIYLLHLSFKLWRQGAAEASEAEAVTLAQVFFATLLNPKSLIIAFTLLPQGGGVLQLMPWLAVLAVEIAVIGIAWVLAGDLLRRGFRDVFPKGFGHRLGAVAMTLLAVAVGAHSIK